MANVVPLLNIMEERDKLQNERKIIDTLVNRFGGKATHSLLLNGTHMKKREFNEAVDSLLEREAIACQAGDCKANQTIPKVYVVNPEIMKSWTDDTQTQIRALGTFKLKEP